MKAKTLGHIVPVQADAVDTLALCAMRYALGRATYIVSEVCGIIEGLPLHRETLRTMARDVREAKSRDDYARNLGEHYLLPLGMDCDRERWLLFLSRLESKIPEPIAPATEARS